MSGKLIRLGKSGIEYLDYVWNFYSGCRHKAQGVCPPDIPCWAEELTKRFKGHYPKGFEPTFYPEAFLSPLGLGGEGKRIGVAFMGDLFGDWVDPESECEEERFRQYIKGNWMYRTIKTSEEDFANRELYPLKEIIFRVIKACPQHTFVFLTKNPSGMVKWGKFPGNCEAGFSATSPGEFIERIEQLARVEAKVKWCSLEPLLKWDMEFKTDTWKMLDWVAIGALTGSKQQIMRAALNLAPELINNESDNSIEVESLGVELPFSEEMLEDIETGKLMRQYFKDQLRIKLAPLTPFQIRGGYWGLMPPVEWLKSIVGQLDSSASSPQAACGTKVFIKDNLWQLIYKDSYIYGVFVPSIKNIELKTFSLFRGWGLLQECGGRER